MNFFEKKEKNKGNNTRNFKLKRRAQVIKKKIK